MPRHHSPAPIACLILAASFTLSGCAPIVLGGTAATTAIVASDRRTAGEQLDDKSIQLKVGSDLSELLGSKARVVPVSYAAHVLLLGDVPSESDKQRASEATKQIEPVKEVYNQLRVGDITPLSVRTNDTWLTTKVTSALINTEGVPTRTMVITTERGVVYLMGKVTADEGERAARAAANVNGVNKVVKLFDIVTPEQLQREAELNTELNNASTTSPGSTPSSSATPASGGIQTMPVQ